MPRPSRARRILKWTGAGLSLMLLALWGGSLPFELTIVPSPNVAFGANGGIIDGIVANHDLTAHNLFSTRCKWWGWRGFGFVLPKIVIDDDFGVASQRRATWFEIPFWLPFIIAVIPTAWLWHRDRRRIRPGCCLRCGYDLTGNTSGVCSECGEKKGMAKSE